MPLGRSRRHEFRFPCFGSGSIGRTRPRAEAKPARRRGDPIHRSGGGPVGSGIVESACKRIVGSRLKGAGRRWSKAGANAVLAIGRCLENRRWPDFLEWRACRLAAA